MNFKGSKIRWVIGLSFALVITLAIIVTITSIHGARATASPTGATIASDKADYQPGATVTLTGAGWASGEDVQIYVNDSVGNTWSLTSGQNGADPDPVANGSGGFTYSFSLPNYFVANYSATATGSTSGIASTTFTDNITVNLDQFANLPGQGWQNGDVNGSNSAYHEGSVVPFRLAIDGLAGSGTHTIHINYDFTAGGFEAYDFLASYNATESPNVCSNVSTAPSGLCPVGSANTLAFPSDTFAPGGNTAAGETVNGAIAFANLPRQLSMWGGTPVSFSSVVHSGDTTKGSSADLVLTFNTGSCTSNCSVLLAWGGHIAQSGYWTKSSGGLNGAGLISGAPFHMRTQNLDGSGNKNQDRSIQPSAILPTMTVNKVLSPSTDPGLFNLLIDGTADASNVGNGGTTHAVTITVGTHTVSETAGTNTDLSSYSTTVSCVDPQGNVVASGTGTSLSVNVISGINVTCTFTNTRKLFDLTVTKDATPSFTRTFTWGITKSVDKTKVIDSSGTWTFNYTVNVTHNGGTDSDWQVNGTITVKNPNGFDVTGVNVTDAISNGGSCTVSGGTGLKVPANNSIQVSYTCKYSSAPNPSSGTNTATATWTNFGSPHTSAQGTATFDFSKVSPTLIDDSVTVTDTLGGALGTVKYTDPSPTTFTYSYTVTGKPGTCVSQDNTATFTTNTNGKTGSDSKTVTLCTPVDLKVTKDATPSFTRTFTWGITKSVDKTKVIDSSGTWTFNYTVTITHDGTDSDWQVNGTITITNPNDFESITLTGVKDAIDDGGTCTISGNTTATIAAGGNVTLPYSCTYSSAPKPSSGTNTATANWDKTAASTPDGSAQGTATFDFGSVTPKLVDDSVTVIDTLGGNLGTVKYTDPSPTTFTYSYTVTGKPGTCVSQDNTATFTTNTNGTTGSDSKTVTLCTPVDLTVKKDATPSFTRTYNWDIKKSVDQPTQNIAAGGTATFNYTVVVTQTGFTDSGWTVTGKITVSNPNDFEDIVANISDAVDNGGSCTVTGGTGVTVPKHDSVTLDYSCTFSSTPTSSSGANTATATWEKATYFTPDGSASSDPVSFDFSTPTSTVNQTVTVTDTIGGTLGTATATDSTPFTSKPFTYLSTETGTPGTCETYPNTATIKETGQTDSASVKLCVGEDLQVTKDATPSFTRTYTWGIKKSVDQTQQNIAADGTATFNYTVEVTHDAGTDSSWTVSGTITVKNPNDWEAITANITDAVDNGGSCSVTNGTNVSVPASGSAQVPYSCTFTSGSSGNNTATATWVKATYFTPDGSASSVQVPFAFTTPTTVVDGSVTVTDTLGGSLGTVSYTDPSPKVFTYAQSFSGVGGTCTDYPNTATFTTKDTGTTGSASKTVKVCVGIDLSVSKTASASFTRTYNWSIAKSVDKTLVEQIGGTATFNYTVNVKETGFTDSGWQVNGTITVTNPNDWEAIKVDVSDAIDGGGICTVSGGTGVSVPASGSKTLNYTCTYALAPNPSSGTNTATATWDSAAFFTPHGSASGTAGYAFTTPTTVINQDISVMDTFNGVTTPLGTLTATDGTPFASATYKYSHTVNVPTSNCVKYTNKAVIVETGQSDSKTVEVCGPAKTGALTMGFWQNKNGQGIISAADQTKLGNWLRQYHPFSDAPSTGLATYVYNIIKAATCTSTSNTCNSMLRAQMLATALDVYFSDSALGGNQIKAPAAIGGVTIDLTKICQMIDSSGGTATCSSTFENVSSAFGGATSMTVLQMLTYQNTSDPAADAGAVWYVQVKATQVLAKDAFDAINNQVAYGP